MESLERDCALVDVLKDINLSLFGIIDVRGGPESRPKSTSAGRHVCEVDNEETVLIGRLGFDPNRCTAISGVLGPVINAHVIGTSCLVVLDEIFIACTLGRTVILILDKSVGRIEFLSSQNKKTITRI